MVIFVFVIALLAATGHIIAALATDGKDNILLLIFSYNTWSPLDKPLSSSEYVR